jgi:hypothetical protein
MSMPALVSSMPMPSYAYHLIRTSLPIVKFFGGSQVTSKQQKINRQTIKCDEERIQTLYIYSSPTRLLSKAKCRLRRMCSHVHDDFRISKGITVHVRFLTPLRYTFLSWAQKRTGSSLGTQEILFLHICDF